MADEKIQHGAASHIHPVDIQVIESKKLPAEENLWLKGLSNDLNAEAAGVILEESRKRGKGAELAAYLHALISANAETIEDGGGTCLWAR
jgi:hypothetical protein